MIRVIVGIAVGMTIACSAWAGAAVAAKPPSFALWTAHWNLESDKSIGAPIASCEKAFGETSTKAGSCVIVATTAAYMVEMPRWSRQVAAVSKGQTATCRAAIHRYWLASRKTQAAVMIYLSASHPGITVATIASDLKDEPIATLGSLTDAAKSRAIRICG